MFNTTTINNNNSSSNINSKHPKKQQQQQWFLQLLNMNNNLRGAGAGAGARSRSRSRFSLFVLIFSLGSVLLWHQMVIIDEERQHQQHQQQVKGIRGGVGIEQQQHQQQQIAIKKGNKNKYLGSVSGIDSGNRNTLARSKNGSGNGNGSGALFIDESFISSAANDAANADGGASNTNKASKRILNNAGADSNGKIGDSKSELNSDSNHINSNSKNKNKSNKKYDGWKEHAVPQDGMAACLLLKDDNDRLSEWLAYHWLTLPLKYLLVAIDPTGTTSPRHILDKWGASGSGAGSGNNVNASASDNNGMGIEIEIWDEVDYDHWINEELDEKHKHRDRQKLFLAECERYHKTKGRSWLAIIDPDEFITYNLVNDDDPGVGDFVDEDVPEKFVEESYVNTMYAIRKGFGSVKNFYSTSSNQNNQSQNQSPAQQTIFSFIQENQNNEPWVNEPCYLMPRLFFSAIESPPSTLSKSNINQYYGLNPLDYSTTRYFYHARRGAFDFNHYGKVLVDLRRIDNKEIEKDMYSIHRPNYKSCHRPVKPYVDGILRVHHYLGSWTQYSAKSDVRRSKARFEEFGSVDYGTDYQLQNWIVQFVDLVGVEKAKYLLQGSGLVEKNDARLIDVRDFVHVQRHIETRHGEKELLTYFYDEDGSIVDIQNSDGVSVPFHDEDILNSVI